MIRAAASMLTAATVFWMIFIGPFCWILRDGLGPDAYDSTGLAAVQRFLLTFYWGPIAALLLGLSVATHTWSRRMKADS